MGSRRFGDNHDPGCVFIQPLHDAGPWHQCQTGIVKQQGILQGMAGIAGARMDDQPWGFIDYQDYFIFIKDIQRDGFSQALFAGREYRYDFYACPGPYRVFLAQDPVIDFDLAGVDPRL